MHRPLLFLHLLPREAFQNSSVLCDYPTNYFRYVAGSSGTNGAGNDPSIGVNRPTETSVFRSKSLDTAPGSTVVDSHTPNSIVSTAGILGQDKAPAKSQETNVLSTKYDNG